jgi:hypothetical protein
MLPTFQGYILHPFSGRTCYFDLENGGSTYFRNASNSRNDTLNLKMKHACTPETANITNIHTVETTEN